MGADAAMTNVRVLKQGTQSRLLSIVVPVLNEQEAAPHFLVEVEKLRSQLGRDFGCDARSCSSMTAARMARRK